MAPKGWKTKTLQELSTCKISNGAFNDPQLVGSGQKLINVVDLYSPRRVKYSTLSRLQLDDDACARFKVKKNDLFFTRSSLKAEGIAHCNIFDGHESDVVYDCHIMRVRPDPKEVTPKYLLEFCQSHLARKYFMSHAKTGTMTTMDQAALGGLPVTLPPLPEQIRISSLLTAWDRAIEVVEQLILNSESQKRALLRMVVEASTLRKWAKKSLGDVARIYDGTHSTPNYVEDGVPFYSVEHLTADDFSRTKLISRSVFEEENKRVRIEKGDILMTRIGDIGTPKYIDWDVEASFYVSLALIKVTPPFNPKFLSVYMQTSAFQRELHKRTIHVAFPKKINLGEIGLCEVAVPPVETQEKIAVALSVAENDLAIWKQKRHCLEREKTALVQQLLTGKRRVRVEETAPPVAVNG